MPSNTLGFIFGVLLTIQIIICIGMAAVILLQRSEGGALGVGGGPSGFMSARGAGNFLTRTTGILGFIFFANSVALFSIGNLMSKTSVTNAVGEDNITLERSAQPAPDSGAASPLPSTTAPTGPSLNDTLSTLPSLPQAGASSSSAAAPVVTVPQPAASSASAN